MIANIFNQIEKEGLPFLGAYCMLSDNDIAYQQIPKIDRSKYIYISHLNSVNDIILGTKYDIIFSRNNPEKYSKIDAEIDFVTLKKNDNIGIIPKGYGGIVRLKFKDKVSELTEYLVQDSNEKFDMSKNSYIYFTTQETIDRILEELKKQENPSV
ncbi:hypothetical protein [Flavobacterium lindanitolerans]|uniref:hypothetical protein n=1 Tax=Flavobacterium lindanitolerans TaxID=428988 RepID=UPI002808B47E|nr:hypothetical protein [Flavobacterium lindanitolerans]MDQ7960264.1 hypothetical protein [Flavobacterium lindanitolerans]